MVNYALLDECIEDYNNLKNLNDLSEQQRGQKFNELIAKTLEAHFVNAKYNQRYKGEIDVCFRIGDKRFLLEAKWEKTPTSMDPISKLNLRINQRMQSNFGIILSINGYSNETLKQMNEAGRPEILLLEKDIFESLLHANIDADVLFDTCVDVAAFEGKMHITLKDVFKYMPYFNMDTNIDTKIETRLDKKVESLLTPKGNIKKFSILKAGLPFGQNGISVSGKKVFVSLSNGLYMIDDNAFTKILNITNPQNRCLCDSDNQKLLFVVNNSVMAIDKDGIPFSISKRYPGHVRIFKSKGEFHLFSNGDDSSTPKQPVRIVENLTGRQREIILDYPICHGLDGCFTEDGCYAAIGSAGLMYYHDSRRIWSIPVFNGASISFYNSRLYFLENGVSLNSIGLDGKEVHNICKFDLSGSVGDFAIASENEYFFHLCYQEFNISKSAIVYVNVA